MAQKESQLGLRRIEIDRGLSEEPKLLRKGLIVPEEVDKLFAIFYDKMNVRPLSTSSLNVISLVICANDIVPGWSRYP
jgi:hypothetical protein